ncbi:beta-fructofuranosidase [Aureococcus anophagefferens]|nr:beta-fructofuranosidase [Aureococcus anophagefferens]
MSVVDDGVDTFVVREGGVGDGFIARLGRGGNCAPATRRFAVASQASGAAAASSAPGGKQNMQHDFNVHKRSGAAGQRPVWGHFATKDLRRWAQLPVALWNGPGDDAVFTGKRSDRRRAAAHLAAVVRRGGAVDVETYARGRRRRFPRGLGAAGGAGSGRRGDL